PGEVTDQRLDLELAIDRHGASAGPANRPRRRHWPAGTGASGIVLAGLPGLAARRSRLAVGQHRPAGQSDAPGGHGQRDDAPPPQTCLTTPVRSSCSFFWRWCTLLERQRIEMVFHANMAGRVWPGEYGQRPNGSESSRGTQRRPRRVIGAGYHKPGIRRDALWLQGGGDPVAACSGDATFAWQVPEQCSSLAGGTSPAGWLAGEPMNRWC